MPQELSSPPRECGFLPGAECRSDDLYEFRRSRKPISAQRHLPASCGRRPREVQLFSASVEWQACQHSRPTSPLIPCVVIPPPNNSVPRRTDTHFPRGSPSTHSSWCNNAGTPRRPWTSKAGPSSTDQLANVVLQRIDSRWGLP